MKAMILAAGKGTRVRPITHTTPKPMIPILQKPVMEFLLELLRQHGFDQIMVNVSHLAEEIENYFRDGQRFGVQIAYSFEGRIEDGELIGDAIGSAGGLKRIQDFQAFFDDTFVVLCGDALIDLDLSEFAAKPCVLSGVPGGQVSHPFQPRPEPVGVVAAALELEKVLGDGPTLVLGPDPLGFRNPHVVKEDLVELMLARDVDDRAHGQARRVAVDQEEGDAALRLGLQVRSHQTKDVRRLMCQAGPDFGSVYDIVVAVRPGTGLK
jgi:hypothetical protein